MENHKIDYSYFGKIAIVTAAFNEGERIKNIIDEWFDFLQQRFNKDNFEVVICNDGSTDDTKKKLLQLSKSYKQLKVVNLENNQGAGFALREAIANTFSDWVVLMDSDGQFNVHDIDNMLLKQLSTRALAVLGERKSKQDNLFMKFGSWSSGLICNFLYRSDLDDFNTAFKLVSGLVIRQLHLEARGLNYSTDITAKLLESNINIASVTVSHLAKSSNRNIRSMLKVAWQRFLFVLYLAFRQLQIYFGVLVVSRINYGE